MHLSSSAVFTCHEELWKWPSMKHSVSLERPQIVEDFIQSLMNGVERETNEQVYISHYILINKGPKRWFFNLKKFFHYKEHGKVPWILRFFMELSMPVKNF